MSTVPSPSEVLPALQSAANTILAVLAPNSARLVQVAVVLDRNESTAYTDGNIVIALPPAFCGHALPDDVTIAVGLLAHEAGHFVHPLPAIRQVEEKRAAPYWLANILLDVHGEAFVAGVFPAMAHPLRATRKAVKTAKEGDYRQALEKATSFSEAVLPAALLGRFFNPDQSFDSDWLAQSVWQKQSWYEEVRRFLEALAEAACLPADHLPLLLEHLITRFPALKRAPTIPLPTYGRILSDRMGKIALGEAAAGSKGYSPGGAGRLLVNSYRLEPPEAKAVRISSQLKIRFAAGAGHIEVAAPQHIDRHALARDEVMPFRMRLPGTDLPAPKAVLCLDISSSMAGKKLKTARVAGQAIALALRETGGEVVAVLFSDDGYISEGGDDTPVFAPLREWQPRSGTSFRFLVHVWRRWPQHLVLLLTDGYGELPTVFPADRSRTHAILIGGEPQRLESIAAQVMQLHELADLPHLMAMLIPRRRRG